MRQGQPLGISPSARARRWCPPRRPRDRRRPGQRGAGDRPSGAGHPAGRGAAGRRRVGVRGGDRDQVAARGGEGVWRAGQDLRAVFGVARRPPAHRHPLASTICDGIAIKRPGDLTLPLVERHLDGIVTVSDDEVAEAMVLLLERSKLVVEGAGAAGVAALLGGRSSDRQTARSARAVGRQRGRFAARRVHPAR